MKKLLFILLTLCMSVFSLQMSAQQTVVIGSGTATNSYLPSYSLYNYSFTQQLYTAEEIGTAGTITSVAFYNDGTEKTRNYTMYLVNTSKTSFANSTDWITVTAGDEVFSGSVTMTAAAWTTITLTTPFFYDGESNLALIMDDNTGSWSSGLSCYVFNATNMALRVYSDPTNYDPMNPGSYSGTVMDVKNQITLGITPGEISCHATGALSVSNITPNNATINWDLPDDAGTFLVQYKEYNQNWDDDEVVTDFASSNSYDFSDMLQANTAYNVRVANMCNNGDTSIWRSTSFRTACDALLITEDDSWTEDFESYTGSGAQTFLCWDTPISDASYNAPFVYCGYGQACHSGQNSAELKGASNMLVLPEFTNDIHDLRLTFWATKTSSSNATVDVGVITDITDPTTFELVSPAGEAGPRGSENGGNGNYMGPFDFNGVLAESGRIALRYNNANSASESWNLDDFTVSIIPDCSAPVPTSVTASDVVAQSATISWQDNDDSHTAWVVYYKANTDDDWQMAPASNTTIELTDLYPSTTYELYVVSVCAGTEGTDATPSISFTTTATCYPPVNVQISQITGTSAMITWEEAIYGANNYTVAYSEAGQDEWTEQTVDGTSLMLSGLQPATHYDVIVFSNCDLGTADTAELDLNTKCLVGGDLQIGEGTNTTGYLPEYCLYNYSYTQQIYLASELSTQGEINSISFNASTIANANRHLMIYLMHTQAASSDWLSASNAQLVYDGTPGLTSGWNTFNFTTPFQYDGTSNLAVIVIDATGAWSGTNYFFCHSTTQNLSHYVYQDGSPYSISSTPSGGSSSNLRNNVIFGIPCDSNATCVAPNIFITEVTAESITVDWAPGYQETAWELEYTDDEDWINVGSVTAPYELTGLDANTIYYIRVRSVCGIEDYSEWTGTSTRTACSAITTLPFSENFDTYGTGTNIYPTCWYKLNTANNNTPYISSTNYQSTGSLYFYSGTSGTYNMAITPEFDETIDLSTLQATFMYRASNASDKLLVGVMSDPTDASTFMVIDTVYPDATSASVWVEKDVFFSSYTGTDEHYIAFKNANVSSSSAYAYIDNLVINTASTCPKPTQLTISDISSSEATLSWTNGGNESSWNIAYGPVGFDPTDEEEEDVNIVATSSNPFILTGLQALTAYDIYIQADCGDGDLSNWILTPVRLETEGCDITEQCTYTFVAGDGYGDGWNNAYIEVIQNGVSVATITAIDHGGSDEQFYDTIAVSLCNNFNTQLIWHSGSYDDEISITLIGADGAEIISINDMSNYSTNDVLETFFTNCSGCITPANLTYTLSEDATSVTLTWEAGGEESSWVLEYQASGDEDWVIETITGTPTYTIDNLSAATIYTIRVKADCGYSMSGYKTVTINTPICNPAEQCEYILTLEDSFGDGWNGAYITVSQNGIIVSTNITIPSGQNQNTVTLSLCDNIPTQLTWHTGSYDSECSFELMGPDGSPVISQSSMSGYTTGAVIDTFTANCSGCMAPVNLTYTLSTDATSATITWDAGGEETDWILEYQIGNNDNWTIENISGTPTYTLNDLTPTTIYTIRVKSDCGEDASGYKTITFETPCSFEVAPYFEDFSGFNTTVSPCWSRYTGLASSVFSGGALTSSSSGWNFTNTNVFPLGHPKVNIYSTTCNYWLVTPLIDLSQLTDPALMFDLALTDYGNANPIENIGGQPDDKFMVIISTDGGSTWVAANATVWDNTGTGNHSYDSISNTGDAITISLSQYAGETIRIAFYGESSASNGDNDLHIANVKVDNIPTCLNPSHLTVTDVSNSSVTLSWTIGDEETAWDIIYGAPGFDMETEGTLIENITDIPYEVTGLNSTTSYVFYVRANCGGGDVSYWSNSVQSSTSMVAESIPYQTDFASDQAWLLNNGDAPNYWMMGTTSGSNTSALFITHNGTSEGYSTSTYSIAMAEKLFTMPAEDSVHVEFDVQAGGESSYDYLKVFLAPATVEFTPGSISSNTQSSYSYSTNAFNFSHYLSQTGYSSYPYKLNLTQGNTIHISMNVVNPDPNGSAKIVFLWRNDSGSGTQPGAIISNFSISIPTVSIENVTMTNSVSLMPNPADNYIEVNVNSNVNVKEAVVYNAFGQMVQTVRLNDNHARIDLSDMASGMYFLRVNGEGMNVTKKFIKR